MSPYDGLIQPMIGFLFVAKDQFGLILNQLNIVHCKFSKNTGKQRDYVWIVFG